MINDTANICPINKYLCSVIYIVSKYSLVNGAWMNCHPNLERPKIWPKYGGQVQTWCGLRIQSSFRNEMKHLIQGLTFLMKWRKTLYMSRTFQSLTSRLHGTSGEYKPVKFYTQLHSEPGLRTVHSEIALNVGVRSLYFQTITVFCHRYNTERLQDSIKILFSMYSWIW